MIHFPGLGEEWLQHCRVGSLHHESWIVWDKVLVTNKIYWAPLNSYFEDPQMSLNIVLRQRGQGRPDNFPYVSYFHCSLGYLFFPACPVCAVGSILFVYLAVAFLIVDQYTRCQFVLFFALHGWVGSLAQQCTNICCLGFGIIAVLIVKKLLAKLFVTNILRKFMWNDDCLSTILLWISVWL